MSPVVVVRRKTDAGVVDLDVEPLAGRIVPAAEQVVVLRPPRRHQLERISEPPADRRVEDRERRTGATRSEQCPVKEAVFDAPRRILRNPGRVVADASTFPDDLGEALHADLGYC